jgi:hypothetical protein
VSGCGTEIRSRTVGMVRGVGVPSSGGVVVTGTFVVIMLHPQEMWKLKLPPLLEVLSSLSIDSSKITPESFPSRERLRLPNWSAMNSKLPKRTVSPKANQTLVWWSLSVTMAGFGE